MLRVLTALAVLTAPLLPRSEPLGADEAEHDHARHPGLTHPEGGDGHRHGDPDDHHETPGSPCHHHEHSCCGGVSLLALVAMETQDVAGPGVRLRLPRTYLDSLPAARETFHVPLS